ncbi:type I restriction enzyme S subunit [Arthrobacter oryzae]|uniref:restriction endonuclease subunit S n=1 Tax=Arthrobacter oryzae TaxID=409290 RepID=UPI00278B894E|nr:restriction endonuclease subunit S [Arthrobacter oryzae]MDP9986648.1 type I restriction enzyme S subunit [Arthrobacter oryzae]
MSEWEEKRLGDLAHVIHGWAFKGEGFAPDTDSSLPVVVAIGNFDYGGGFRFTDSTVKRYAAPYPKEYELDAGDLVMVMTCQTEGGEILGVPALVPNDGQVYLHNQRIGKLVIDAPDLLDADYMYHLARSAEFNRQLFVTASGSKILHTSPSRIEATIIKCPSLPEQKRIAEILGALDEKIAANTKLVSLIDAHLGLEYTATVLDSASALPLSEVAEFHNRKRVPLSAREREQRRGDVPYYGASGVFGTVDTAIFDEPLVLVGEDGSVINDDGTPVSQYIWGPAWVNNHAHVLTGKGISTELLFLAISRTQVATLVTGAVQPKINMGNLKRLTLEIPSADRRVRLEQIVKAETASKRAAIDESRTLAAIRDALLPQLMSGKLRVKDAEKVLENAGV